MSIIEHTPKLDLTQYTGSSVKAQFYANYNSDMQKIDSGYATLDEAISGEEGLGARVSALETTVTTIDEKADNAVSTANDAKTTAEGFDTRVTTLEGKVSDLETWAGGVDTTLEAYDGRLDAIEEVIETVSTANINDLIARMDALEQKVDANTQSIDTLNDNLISAVNRIVDLETGLGTTNANLNTLAGRVTLLEDCCSSVRETLTDHNTRINKNASDISALDARLTRDETNIAGNASDITILATQNNTQSQQIDDLYSKYNALDPTSPTNLYSRVQTLEDTMGNSPLQTVAQTVTGAINELFGHATDVDADEVDYDNTNSQLVATDVQGAIDEVNGKVDVDSARIGALETTVGGAGSGLVKDVSDLQTTVGDNSAGLVKDVADLGTTVGDATAGLVKDVADLQTTVGDATAGLVKSVDDLESDAQYEKWTSLAELEQSDYSTYGNLANAFHPILTNGITDWTEYEFRIVVRRANELTQIYSFDNCNMNSQFLNFKLIMDAGNNGMIMYVLSVMASNSYWHSFEARSTAGGVTWNFNDLVSNVPQGAAKWYIQRRKLRH